MIEFKIEDSEQLKGLFDPKLVNKAINTSLNKTTQKTRTFISKKVRTQWNIKARDINSNVTIRRVPGGRIIAYAGTRPSLMKFSPTLKNINTVNGKRTGLSVRVKKNNGRKVVKHAFVGFGASGNFMAFKRQNKERLPVRRLTGPAIAQMVSDPLTELSVIGFVNKEQANQFDSAMDFWLKKQMGTI